MNYLPCVSRGGRHMEHSGRVLSAGDCYLAMSPLVGVVDGCYCGSCALRCVRSSSVLPGPRVRRAQNRNWNAFRVPYEDCWDCCVKETKHLDYDVA